MNKKVMETCDKKCNRIVLVEYESSVCNENESITKEDDEFIFSIDIDVMV
jgi:hypothetical protein